MSDLRMPDLNRVFLAGRLTRDPELRYLPSGTPVCKMGLAVSRFYRSKEGERREETLFINVEAWSKTAEFCGERLKKGRPVIVEGRLQSSEWEDRSGQKRTTIDVRADRIQQIDWDDNGPGGYGGSSGPSGPSSGRQRPDTEEPVADDDVPF